MDFAQTMGLVFFLMAAGMAAIPFVSKGSKPLVATATVVVNSAISSLVAALVLAGDKLSGSFSLPHLAGDIFIRIDGLSAWFILIINFTCVNGILYGRGYLKAYENHTTSQIIHWVCYPLLHASLLAVTMVDHGVAFLFSWELMSLSALLLLMFDYQDKTTVRAGINYMIQMHLCVVFFVLGFVLLYMETGSFSFSAIAELPSTGSTAWIIVLLFLGFAVKAGFLPFHTWLPEAHPAAPAHVSGVMSGVVVKMGIYGIFRVAMNLRHDFLLAGEVLMCLSAVSSLYGIGLAVVSNDFKRMLAYCTIENVGIIGIALGLGLVGIGIGSDTLAVLGLGAALLHTLNHALYKAMLFFCSGNIYQQTHTRNIEQLGGLAKAMPITAACFLVGAMAIGGLPPFNGFVSKYLIYSGLFGILDSSLTNGQVVLFVLTIVSLTLAGGASIIAFTKTFGVVFLGNPRTHLHKQPTEVPTAMLIPQLIIIAAMLSVAMLPGVFLDLAAKAFAGLIPTTTIPVVTATSTLASVGKVSLIFASLVAVLWGLRHLLLRHRPARIYETWGCGYTAPIPKAQYKGHSFIRSFGGLFKLIIKKQKDYEKIERTSLYPMARSFTSKYMDAIEEYLVSTVARWSIHLLHYFQFVQNGQIQLYIIYGILFIVLVVCGTLMQVIQ